MADDAATRDKIASILPTFVLVLYQLVISVDGSEVALHASISVFAVGTAIFACISHSLDHDALPATGRSCLCLPYKWEKAMLRSGLSGGSFVVWAMFSPPYFGMAKPVGESAQLPSWFSWAIPTVAALFLGVAGAAVPDLVTSGTQEKHPLMQGVFKITDFFPSATAAAFKTLLAHAVEDGRLAPDYETKKSIVAIRVFLGALCVLTFWMGVEQDRKAKAKFWTELCAWRWGHDGIESEARPRRNALEAITECMAKTLDACGPAARGVSSALIFLLFALSQSPAAIWLTPGGRFSKILKWSNIALVAVITIILFTNGVLWLCVICAKCCSERHIAPETDATASSSLEDHLLEGNRGSSSS